MKLAFQTLSKFQNNIINQSQHVLYDTYFFSIYIYIYTTPFAPGYNVTVIL